MTEVKFQARDFVPGIAFTYSVIAARFEGKWIYVRHHDRSTWEIPGGHIEEGESPDDAAGRELMEETGAVEFTLSCVSSYSVFKDGITGYGKLYFAESSGWAPYRIFPRLPGYACLTICRKILPTPIFSRIFTGRYWNILIVKNDRDKQR